MKINKQRINKELRPIAYIYKHFLPSNDAWMLGVQYKLRNILKRKTKGLLCGETWIQRQDGSKLRLCIYKSSKPSTKRGPAVLWLHGGGYALGVPEMCGKLYKKMLDISGGVIVAPDYTLSMEKPYPAAIEDSYLALLWLKEHAIRLGGRDDQLMIGGESAGGGLAIATTLLARRKKTVNIAFQMPIYPMIDDRMQTSSMLNNDAPVWNVSKNTAAWKLYLGDLFETNDVPTYAAPARETDVSRLPPAVTYVGDLDPFLDETKEYIRRLRAAGIQAQCRIYRGCYHGFDIVAPHARVSQSAIASFLEAYLYAVKHYSLPQA